MQSLAAKPGFQALRTSSPGPAPSFRGTVTLSKGWTSLARRDAMTIWNRAEDLWSNINLRNLRKKIQLSGPVIRAAKDCNFQTDEVCPMS